MAARRIVLLSARSLTARHSRKRAGRLGRGHVMNRAFGVEEYGQSSSKTRRGLRAHTKPKRWITVKTGQTGDEGWFAPTCTPQKWVNGSSNTCLEDTARQTGLSNYFGANCSSAIPSQSRLDKIPAVMPLRSLGLTSLVGRKICAVVYDSDISINYNRSTFPFTDGNLQGETLGVIAFTVTQVRQLDGFSSSTLPHVTLRIEDAAGCNPSQLFNAPVPESSSVPNDRLVPPSTSGYRQPKTFPDLPLFF